MKIFNLISVICCIYIVHLVVISGEDLSAVFQRGWNGQDVTNIAGAPIAVTVENATMKVCMLNCIRKGKFTTFLEKII